MAWMRNDMIVYGRSSIPNESNDLHLLQITRYKKCTNHNDSIQELRRENLQISVVSIR